MRLVLAMLLAAACGGASKPAPKPPDPIPDPIPATAGPACRVVAEHLVTVVLADKPDEHAAAIQTLGTRCAEDKWSDEARSCLATAQSDSEAEGCVRMLSAPQRDKLELIKADPAEPAAAAAPPPADVSPKKPTTRGAVKKPPKTKPKEKDKEGADPCEGGESDPCQGGE